MSDTSTRAHRMHLESQVGRYLLQEKVALQSTRAVGGDTSPLKPTGKTGPLAAADTLMVSTPIPASKPRFSLVRLFG